MSENRPPILRDFPESFETERLLVRSPLPGDGPEMHAAVDESLDRYESGLALVASGASLILT